MKSKFSIGAQLGILIFTIFIGLVIAGYFLGFIVLAFNLKSDLSNHTVFLISVFVSQLLGFIGGFFAFLKITSQSFKGVIKVSTPTIKQSLFILVILVACIPIIQVLGYYNAFLKDIIPNNSFVIQEIKDDLFMSDFFAAKNIPLLLIKIIGFAVLPAIGEELVFRGVLLSKIKDVSNNEHYAVIVSGVLFAAIHTQPAKLLPMIFLGIVLGYIYTRTKNIFYPMLFHFSFNTVSILSAYYLPEIVT